jgi:fermentation-respiration switch protein FrsA (DUF1100 family)
MSAVLAYLLGVLATAGALVLIAAWLIAGQIVRRREPDPACTPEDVGLPFEHVTFPSRDGVMLGGRLTSERGSRRPVVVFCAGLFGSMDGDTALVPHFFSAGFDVLQFDWRGHGISDGRRVTLGIREADDLRGALDFLQARGVRAVGLMGFSMGGAVALRVAAEARRAICLAVDGPLVHVRHAVQGFLRKRTGMPLRPFAWLVVRLAGLRLGGLPLGEASPLSAAGRISPRPVLFIHGADDPFVPPADQDALFGASGEPKTLWRVAGAGHREAYDRAPEDYLSHVIGFFQMHLGAGSIGREGV